MKILPLLAALAAIPAAGQTANPPITIVTGLIPPATTAEIAADNDQTANQTIDFCAEECRVISQKVLESYLATGSFHAGLEAAQPQLDALSKAQALLVIELQATDSPRTAARARALAVLELIVTQPEWLKFEYYNGSVHLAFATFRAAGK